jgi:hypothetical protein
MEFAPKAFRETRLSTAKRVEYALKVSTNPSNISCNLLKAYPEILQILRMSTCPPIARDRLIGLARVSKSLVDNMENLSNPHISTRISLDNLDRELDSICNIIKKC